MRHTAIAVMLCSALLAGEQAPTDLVTAGGEPVEQLSAMRERICLNGVWSFCPAVGAGETDPAAGGWGWIRVPGSWNGRRNLPGLVVNGTGPAWQAFDGAKLGKAWYERPLDIPATWKGRAVLLELRRVSTDAQVLIDGRQVGEVHWPGGTVDLTSAVSAGRQHRLRLLVAAVPDAEKALNAMGVGQNTLVEAKLESRGIIGETFLSCRPRGAHLSDIHVITSVAKRTLTVDAELTGATAGEIALTASIRDGAAPGGAEVRSFSARAAATGAAVQRVQFTSPWPDAKLWDVGQPNLYTLHLTARGSGLDDVLAQQFGFREIRIEGRRILLNGSEFRLRPTTAIPEGIYSGINGQIEAIDLAIDSILAAGFNINELWPSDETQRGTFTFRDLICKRADRKGLPLMAPARSAAAVIRSWPPPMRWNDPGVKEGYEAAMAMELRATRNSPSVVIWSTTANVFGHVEDQDPRRVGRDLADPVWRGESAEWTAHMRRGQELCDLIARHDPTRPVLVHQGGPVGSIYAINNYLCLIPLQEREEWLSAWSADGDMPYCAIEFGTPLHCTMMRGRSGFGENVVSEPLMSEFCAVYLGAEAYRLEQPAYREAVRSMHKKDQTWSNWHFKPVLDAAPAFQALQDLFIANTWRSWRTWGVTGGMIPWSNAQGFDGKPGRIEQAPWTPGRRGTWSGGFNLAPARPYSEDGQAFRPAGRSLIANNGPTLTWIAGPLPSAADPGAWTAKDHLVRAGERLEKTAVLINDGRAPAVFSCTLRASLADGTVIGAADGEGTLAIGAIRRIPLAITVPPGASGGFEVRLQADIAGRRHEDRFACSIVAEPARAAGTLAVHDPEGATTAWLRALGYATEPWTGGTGQPVVIGRRAWSAGALPGDPAALVRGGGRLLIMAQDPAWMQGHLGLRLAAHASRRAFPMAGPLAVEADWLRDWRGHGSLLAAFPTYGDGDRRAPSGTPYAGWRWGNRGTVASAMIEKPHAAGWRPLAEGEFDLAYAPALELDLGRGRATLCTFDLEGRVPGDPAATQIAARLVQHVVQAPLLPRRKTQYLGDDAGAALLASLGLEHVRAAGPDPDAGLIVVGEGVDDAVLEPALARGANVLWLARRRAEGPFGLRLVQNDDFHGSLAVPAWPEARGLSASELRRRAPGPAWLIADGEAGGQLARIVRGRGTGIVCQLDPGLLDADTRTWNRYTRWRQHRAIVQMLANLGGTFAADGRALVPWNGEAGRITLAGDWRALLTTAVPAAAKPGMITDPGLSPAAAAAVRPEVDDGTWQIAKAPGMWEPLKDSDGEAVLRRWIEVPAAMAAGETLLSLGALDDFDITFVNGVEVGRTGAETADSWRTSRRYRIAAGVLKPGRNLIAIRLYDTFGGGGFNSVRADLHLDRPQLAPPPALYHPDYRADFPLGDDPYRYYRW